MKGKSIFTQQEANEILTLIEEKLNAEPSPQKGIRAKIRKLGFYHSDFNLPRRVGGYNQEVFLRVVRIMD